MKSEKKAMRWMRGLTCLPTGVSLAALTRELAPSLHLSSSHSDSPSALSIHGITGGPYQAPTWP